MVHTASQPVQSQPVESVDSIDTYIHTMHKITQLIHPLVDKVGTKHETAGSKLWLKV